MICSPMPCFDLLGRVPREFGTDDVGRAAAICNEHQARSLTTTVPKPRIPRFMEGWQACEKVWAAWLDSEAARKEREYQAEQERQREFIENIAKGLR